MTTTPRAPAREIFRLGDVRLRQLQFHFLAALVLTSFVREQRGRAAAAAYIARE